MVGASWMGVAAARAVRGYVARLIAGWAATFAGLYLATVFTSLWGNPGWRELAVLDGITIAFLALSLLGIALSSRVKSWTSNATA